MWSIIYMLNRVTYTLKLISLVVRCAKLLMHVHPSVNFKVIYNSLLVVVVYSATSISVTLCINLIIHNTVWMGIHAMHLDSMLMCKFGQEVCLFVSLNLVTWRTQMGNYCYAVTMHTVRVLALCQHGSTSQEDLNTQMLI